MEEQLKLREIIERKKAREQHSEQQLAITRSTDSRSIERGTANMKHYQEKVGNK